MPGAFHRSSVYLGLVLALASVPAAVAQNLEALPKIQGESLANQNIELPEAASGKIAVLVFGFSKASKAPTSAWAKKISADFSQQSGFVLYQLPVLEDVPRFVRGMVISSMRKGVAPEMRDHFVPILTGEADLKKLVGYKEPDDAYLVLIDRDGKIAAQTHGALTDANYAEFRIRIDSLLKSSQ